jgi:epoxyqueuosine reductase
VSPNVARAAHRPVDRGIQKRRSRHISQEVRPWNRFATPSSEEAFLAREGLDGPSLIGWMTMSQEEFSARFKGSPIKLAKRRGLLRNVAVALGNWGSPEAVPRSRSG